MQYQSQNNDRNPYSPLLCIGVFLMFGAATQVNAFVSWF